MADYLLLEDGTGRLLLEDGSGDLLLETSAHAITISGGGTLTVTGTASQPTASTLTTQAGGNLLLPAPRRQRRPRDRYPVPVIREGSVALSGDGRISARGRKHASGQLVVIGGGTADPSGYMSSQAALVRYHSDGTITELEPIDTGPTLDEQLQRLLEDAIVLTA